ncbi:hypothetical protein [Ruegeria faecimaris]|uniref:hypothetical protein n=1 Tax=Ruegeria faecimaris TaxID=686389 RepID=UPI00232FAECF|nr:hypothetical protein [Ruegeria faecimaris]
MQRDVHSQGDLKDSDVIDVQGMTMRVAQAKELGLLSDAFDEQLSIGAARRAAQEHGKAQEQTPEKTQRSDTGYTEYDTATDALNAALDDGSIEYEEASQYHTALGEVALAGLSVDEVVNTVEGLADGSLVENEVSGETLSMISSVEKSVTEAATQSAIHELGQEGFDQLDQLANAHPGVRQVIRQYAVDRVSGQSDGVTWAALAADLREQLGYQ